MVEAVFADYQTVPFNLILVQAHRGIPDLLVPIIYRLQMSELVPPICLLRYHKAYKSFISLRLLLLLRQYILLQALLECVHHEIGFLLLSHSFDLRIVFLGCLINFLRELREVLLIYKARYKIIKAR